MNRVIHLHRDYSTTWCGKDASHLLTTHDAGAMTCASCRKQIGKQWADADATFQKEQRLKEEHEAEQVAALKSRQAQEEEDKRRTQEQSELRRKAFEEERKARLKALGLPGVAP